MSTLYDATSRSCHSEEQTPIGLQIDARHWNEALVLRAAWSYQQVTDWHPQRPSL